MVSMALWDLVSPYFLLGDAAGNAQAAVAALFVEEHEQASDANTTVIRGVGRFDLDVSAFFDPTTLSFGATAATSTGHPRDDPSQRNPWIDLRDTTVEFQLVANHIGSTTVQAGANMLDSSPGGSFEEADRVLDALDDPPALDLPTSDYPSTDFRLELVFTAAVLRPPFLQPAQLRDDGFLEPHATKTSVGITLPRIKITIAQDATTANLPVITLDSFGSEGLDAPSDRAVAELITMDPPFAFFGSGEVAGFAFESAVLDLSAQSTPTAILDQFGYDASWTGIYLPDIRLFVQRGGDGIAVSGGAKNLLIGFGQTPGVTGDFELDVLNQGTGALTIDARFSLPDGTIVAPRMTGANSAVVELPDTSVMVAHASGRRPPYTYSTVIDGGTAITDRTVSIDLSSNPSRTIVITVDAPVGGQQSLTITARRQDASGGDGSRRPTPQAKAPTISNETATQGGSPIDGPLITIVSHTDSTVTLELADRSPAAWTVGGQSQGTSPRITVDLAPDTQINVEATIAGTTTTVPVYFRFDEPEDTNNTPTKLDQFASNPNNTRTTPSIDAGNDVQAPWSGPGPVLSDPIYRDALGRVSPGDSLTVIGHASQDGPEGHNLELSRRRAEVAANLYRQMLPDGVTVTVQADGEEVPHPPEGRRGAWRAELSSGLSVPEIVSTAQVARAATDVQPPVPLPTVPPEPERPSWFRSIGAKVRIVRDDFVALQIHGEVDFDTASEEMLRDHVDPGQSPSFSGLGAQNPGDGIVAFRGVFTRDPGSTEWGLTIMFGADPSDVDGLLFTGTLPGQAVAMADPGRNFLGLFALFLPLFSEPAAEDPPAAEVIDIAPGVAAVAVPGALTATGWFNVQRVIWYGGETVVAHNEGQWQTMVLLDVEIAVSGRVNLGSIDLLTIADDKPLLARYKAVGMRFGQTASGDLVLGPVFDSSRGYTIDLAKPGSLTVADPLDRLLKVVGARVSRTNPTFLEINLDSAVDLGVFSLERAGVRLQLAPDLDVELTALGIGVDVPGVISGSGYLEILREGGFAGRVDITLPSLRLRIAAALRIQEVTEGDRTATAVAIALEVEFPVGIPLWSSGLGLYGFLGLFAMHFTRNEIPDAAASAKALSWLKRAGGDPTQVNRADLWRPELDRWAFGVGALVGTMGTPIVFNLKGMVLLELPGPRLLLMMKANVILPMPELEGDAEGLLLAVIDLDVERGTLTIGISIDFTIDPIVQLRIPIEAFFNAQDPGDWHLFIGKFKDKIRAKVIGVFEGSGYVMILGDGQQKADELNPELPVPAGFTIATGIEVAMLWGDRSIRLYAELAAGFDAIVGFSPLIVAGKIFARGELRLFIISLGVYAELNVLLGDIPDADPPRSGYVIAGEVCGKIDLFFFSIEACVDFRLSDEEPPPLVIPPLVGGVSLVSRTPALVHGTATAPEGIDAAIAEAIAGDTEPNWNAVGSHPDADTPEQAAIRKARSVPINAIPLAVFDAVPDATGLTFLGEPVIPPSSDGVVTRSNDVITYRVTAVTLNGPLNPGPTPATWQTRNGPDGGNESGQLALLSWVPDPTPNAFQRSAELTQTVTHRWGTVCHQAAPATPVLWTFLNEPLGPSAQGWMLQGEPWPDPPNTIRSKPTPTTLFVRDRWRCGDPMVDDYRGIVPATVVGAQVFCLPDLDPPDPGPVLELPDDLVVRPPFDVDLDIDIGDLVGRRPNVGLVADAARRLEAERVEIERALIASRDDNEIVALAEVSASLREASAELARIGSTDAAELLAAAAELSGDETQGSVIGSAGRRLAGRRVTERLIAPLSDSTMLVNALRSGGPINRAALSFENVATLPIDNPVDNLEMCESRVLASPRFDTLNPPDADTDLAQDIVERWDDKGFDPGDLHNAVVLEPGCFEASRLLLFVALQALRFELVTARALDEDGNVVDEKVLTLSDVMPVGGLPAPWIDFAGPWVDDVFVVRQFETGLAITDKLYEPVLVTFEGVQAHSIVIGESQVIPQPIGALAPLRGPAFYVGVVEALLCAEIEREDFDTTSVENNHAILESALSGDSADVALLQPNTTYSIDIEWEADANSTDADGNAINDSTDPPPERFWFRTADQAPTRLDPWILATTPYEEETYVFGGEPMTLAFSTNDMHQLFEAYGRRLEVRFSASSGIHPEGDEGADTNPFPLDDSTVVPTPGSVFTPWEDTVGSIIDPDCVEVEEERIRHSMAQIVLPLRPRTDYLMDVVSSPISGGTPADDLVVFRRRFSTSLYDTLESFAQAFIGSRVRHRSVPTGLAASIDAEFSSRPPEGGELDRVIAGVGGQQGIDPLEVPTIPKVTVWWESAGPTPQPVAVVIDSTEPMWRHREIPTLQPPVDSTMEHYRVTQMPLIAPVESSAGDGIVDRIVRAPGDNRAVVLLRPGARGARLVIDLERMEQDVDFIDGDELPAEFHRMVDVELTHAPWEEI